MRVLVLGGTGHFGARLSRRLGDEPGVHLLLSSRSAAAAEQAAVALRASGAQARVEGVALDHQATTFGAELARLAPRVVVHTAGPFQVQDYRVARACMDCGSHYIDLADGREFVAGFEPALAAQAQAAGVLLVSGASTLPGLSSAVVLTLCQGWRHVDEVRICIAPARQTPRGRSTIAAVLGYCGQPLALWEGGAWRRRHGWQGLALERFSFLPPRLGALCDVPDLALFPQRLPGLRSISFRAALAAWPEHAALWLCAALRRLGLVNDWAAHAAVFERLGKLQLLPNRAGGAVGGMVVEVAGQDAQGRATRLHWGLRAGQNHGPEIPVTPALALVRKLLHGQIERRGAHVCWGLISLEDFAREVADLDIAWTCTTVGDAGP